MDDTPFHGGKTGFDQAFWEVKEHSDSLIRLFYFSKDGKEHFPGNLIVWVEYRLTDDNCLELEFTAQSDQDTIINLTNHPYFNLGGHSSGNIGDHQVWINANSFIPVSEEFVPLGGFSPVSNSPFDFQTPTFIRDVISSGHEQLNAVGGFDHSFRLTKKTDEFKPAATVTHPKSGRILKIWTSEPALHFYTANTLNVHAPMGKDGTAYAERSAFCMEPQHFPDSIHQDDFPTTVLKANQIRKSKSVFKFELTNNI